MFVKEKRNMSTLCCWFPCVLIVIVLWLATPTFGEQALVPPYFNLAQGKRIHATSTCGEDQNGNPEYEMYCNLVGSATETEDANIIHGQNCDYCQKGVEGHWHPPDYSIDGTERWWQSPPLSRGSKYSEVNLTIDLGQEYHVAYVILRTANSPRPGVWALERSNDGGQTFEPWQYFAENPQECEKYFGRQSIQSITADDSVTCEVDSRLTPLQNAEIFVRLLDHRPSQHNFFMSDVLQNFTRATHVRLRFLRTKTMLGHLMSRNRQDSSITRRYFYSIKGIFIGGRCRCNGHADFCDSPSLEDPYKFLCACQHNTCGAHCQICCPGYVQKAWKISTNSTPFSCEPCNCHGHSNECEYDEQVDRQKLSLDLAGNYEGGGVCRNCRHNTEGINCEKCIKGYFRPYGKPLDAYDTCQPCSCNYHWSSGNCQEGSGKCECSPAFAEPNCDSCNVGFYDYPNCRACDCHHNGTRGSVCTGFGDDGQCPCKQNYAGQFCDRCADGFYNFPECLPCGCEDDGSVSNVCDPENGECECKNNFGGRQCQECENGYWNFPSCQYCNCDVQGTREGICDKATGQCLCREGYSGDRCDQCDRQGFYGYPECKPCNCSSVGSASTICDVTGKCPCLSNFGGRACFQCLPGYYQYPDCLPCSCNEDGSMGVSCDDEGKCQCKASFDGLRCEECREGFYNFPHCEECNCDPAGTLESFGGCADSPPGELCQCKERAEGRICNVCKPLFWNLQLWNPLGCEPCDCHGPGVLGAVRVCESKGGQCPCKNHVGSRQCTECLDGFYSLSPSDVFGCQDCGCDVGGSVDRVCDKLTGQCNCRPRIDGPQCKTPLQTHYFPSLFQYQHEAEDGRTPAGGSVRFGYDNDVFPDHSWRGYAIYSPLQPETLHSIEIDKPALYMVVMRYKNPGPDVVVGEIKAVPENPSQDETQSYKVRFEPQSEFITVAIQNRPVPFILSPGRWQFSIETDQYLLVDYFVLLPEAYYEGGVLAESVEIPCKVNTTARTRGSTLPLVYPDGCTMYRFPSIEKFDSKTAAEGYALTSTGDRVDINRFYTDKRVNDVLDINSERMAVLSTPQPELGLELPVSKSGRYALLLEYFTPQGANLTQVQVQATSKKGVTEGRALIHSCQYAFLCRQVVTTQEGEVAVFKFDPSSINILLNAVTPLNNANDQEPGTLDRIAINRITAIPLTKWSLDHIRPSQFCVVKNGTCLTSGFEHLPNSLKLEAESGDPDRIVPDDSMPEGVTGAKLVLLDDQNRELEISGRVPISGYYNILVHYHQPENPEFQSEVLIQDGQHYQAKLRFVHCPAMEGCRVFVSQEDDNNKFYIQNDFMVTLKSPKNVWIDYILMVPAEQGFQRKISDLQKYLVPNPVDDTARFIAECGHNHFHIPSENISQFCRDSIFSITADYNNGALPCQCDFHGSNAFECDEYGGQCPCKDFVIGRTCKRCKTGYYGFPDCKPCDCPSTALCDEATGACICPRNVVGEKCNTCSHMTYGFDALIGCEDCNCSPLGVENGNLQCDLETGQCICKANLVGRDCGKCERGFWAYPHCQMCDCEIRGTTKEICDQETATCHCKSNVEGRSCEQCNEGSFNLQEQNPTGCTSCFCFGKTTRCTSSYMFWNHISFEKKHWTAVALDPASRPSSRVETGYQIEFEYNNVVGEDDRSFAPIYIPEDTVPEQDEHHTLYFRVEINANHLASVGGNLAYTVVSEPDESGQRDTFGGPDVILEGRDLPPSLGTIRLMHFSIDHLDGENKMRMNLPLTEENLVVTSQTGGGSLVQATRDQLMIVMKGLKAIYIRAGYWKHTREIRLNSFALGVAAEDYRYGQQEEDRAVTVEQCHCPPNYQGLSCEECSPGYYRSPAGPFGGFCIPCQCNGHSDICDPVSGICQDCKHNTTGEHCETCDEGYHGDATIGTPYDCLICACPIPMASNNFATKCELSPDGRDIRCTCKSGYVGDICQSCSSGHYGRPEYVGDYCKPCSCSGNIDPTDPFACDTVTGACLKCLNDTGGSTCERCKPGYYGDAIISKDCRKCSCDNCGTQECDHKSGECLCLNNVEGYLCDRCKPDHFGLSRCDGQGCHNCNCAIAAVSTQCDDGTGQCECRKGTTGIRCERCAPGYWNYTSDGCQPCECNTEYAIGVGCDPRNGQCSCLPGVVGERCERCEYRWVLIEDRGCQQCDSCQHQLLDVTDELARDLDPIRSEFENKAASYFTTQRLAYFNDTVTKLKPSVSLLNPSKADLSEYYTATNDIERTALTQRQKAEIMVESLANKGKQSAKLKEKSKEVESKVQQAVAKATTTVFETKEVMEGLLKEDRPSSTPQADAARAEAEAIIAALESISFDHTPALEENSTVSKVIKEVTNFVQPLEQLNIDLHEIRDRVDETKDKLRDMRNQSDYAINTSRKSRDIGNKITATKFPVKFLLLEQKAQTMLDNAAQADEMNRATPEIQEGLRNSYYDLGSLTNSVKEQGETLQTMVDRLADELRQNENTVAQSQDHAQQLEYEADALDRTLRSTKAYAERAVAAATAYKNIEGSLQDASKATEKAKADAGNATKIITELHGLGVSVSEPARNMVVLALTAQKEVELDLKIPLRDAKSSISNVEVANNITGTALGNFEKELGKLTAPKDTSDINNAIRTSKKATEKAGVAQDNVEQILTKLPEYSERMKKFRLTVSDLNQETGISDTQVKQAKDSIPLSSAITGSLESKKPDFEQRKAEVTTKLAELKAQIAAAREQANRIPVGLSLQDSSTLLLENPQSLESQQAQTRVSFYFKTEDDGLVFYLGNEPGRKEEDFMAVEVDQGYPVLNLDLGSGPQRIINEKYVRDNQWYKVSVDRSGKAVRFAVAHEDQNQRVEESVREDYLVGSKSLFNVDRNSSKLFIGGLPYGVVRSPVRYSTFRGAVEGLVIGDEKVGLWNFKDAQNVAPHEERDRFIELQRETGLRFQGNGYAILDRKQYPMKERSSVIFRFKTRSKNGLIFLVGKGRKYMAIFVSNGNVAFQYDLGSGTASSRTQKVYNDGQWHTLEAVRYQQRGYLTVDSERVGGDSPGNEALLTVGDYMYWGGYPGDHGYPSVTNKPFEGCIEQVTIDQAPVDLTIAVESRYTVVGCPSSQFAPTVATFFGQGYVSVSSADSTVSGPVVLTKDDTFELNFRLRSNDTQGLVFYGTDADQSNYLSVSMEDGALHVKTEPGGAQIMTDPIDDQEWHVITVTRDRGQLVVNIDDSREYTVKAPNGPLELSTRGSILFFGGKPDDFDIRSDAGASSRPYSGCMADISINGARLDFSESNIKDSSVGQKCFTSEERDAMAAEFGLPEANGWRISKDEDDIEGPYVDKEYYPTPPEPDYAVFDKDKDLKKEDGNGWDHESEEYGGKVPDEVTPTPFMQCALPYREAPSDDVWETVNIEDGVMFGNHHRSSRLEFNQPRGDGASSEYSIDFKTTYGDGLILMWTNFDKTDYIAVFLRKGFLHYAFDSGAGPAFLNSSTTYNDTKWHNVRITRLERNGELHVDGSLVAVGISGGSTTEVNAGNTTYVGGLPPEGWARMATKKKLLTVDTPFRGCLRNLFIRGNKPGVPKLKFSVQPCGGPMESGMFFYSNAGYLKLSDQFRVGKTIKLSMTIKPRHPSGILVAAHGDKDYMILQLINGTIKFTIDSGRGPLWSAFQKDTFDLCDGQWHTIRVTKSKNVVTLALDNQYSQPGFGPSGRDPTNTISRLYVGGHPDPKSVRGIETTEQFVGCMKDFVVENRQYKLNYESIQGTVGLYSCPRN